MAMRMLLTMTIPVIAHLTTVSQKVTVLETLAIFLTPPTITIEAKMVTMPPITTGSTPNTFCPIVLIALACTVLPIPNDAIAVNKAKRTF